MRLNVNVQAVNATMPGEEPGLIETILGRRSTRNGFTDRPIPDETLLVIVGCGLAAPSSKNAQPWRLHVVTDGASLRAFADAVEGAVGAEDYVPRDPKTGLAREDWPSTVAESADVLRHAVAAVFVENIGVFSNGRRTLASVSTERLAGSLVGYTFEVLGLGAAIQNMCLAAHALGVQGAFMGDVVIAEAEISSALGIAGDLVGVLALGYSTTPPRPPEGTRAEDDRLVWHHAR